MMDSADAVLTKMFLPALDRVAKVYPEGLFDRLSESNPGKLVVLAMSEAQLDQMWLMTRENMGFYNQFVGAVRAWEEVHMETFRSIL